MLFICFMFAFKFFQHLLRFYLSSTQTDMAAASNKVNYLLSFSPNNNNKNDAAFIANHIQLFHQIGGCSSKVQFKLKEIENMERYQNHDHDLQELWSMIMISNCAIIFILEIVSTALVIMIRTIIITKSKGTISKTFMEIMAQLEISGSFGTSVVKAQILGTVLEIWKELLSLSILQLINCYTKD